MQRRSTPRKSKFQIEAIESRLLLSGAIPHLLKDINLIPTRPTGHIENITVVGNEVFFTAFDAATGVELWKSDGTAVGTTLVKDIWTGPNSSSPTSLANVDGTLFFAANNGTNGIELWKSDGTEIGTEMVTNIRVPVPPTIEDPNPPDLSSTPNGIVEAGGVAYFQANDGLTGAELWRSDGTPQGTFLVADINPGTATNGTPLGSAPRNLIEFNDGVVFRADDGVTGVELYKSDGFSYAQIYDLNPNSASGVDSRFAIVNSLGTLYFTGRDAGSGFELWKTLGVVGEKPTIIDAKHADFPLGGILVGSGSSIPTTPQLIPDGNGGVYLTASNGTAGFEPWHTNGVVTDSNGTYMIKDVFSGSGSSDPTGFTIVGSDLFFAATNGTQNVYSANNPNYDKVGIELWKSDGLNSLNGGTTALVKNIRPDPVPNVNQQTRATLSSSPANLFAFNGKLYFTANDGDTGIELWTSDGTDAGTVLVENIRPEPLSNDQHPASSSSTPVTFVTTDTQIFFQADDGTTGGELWVSDGTVTDNVNDGTHLTKDIYLGTDNLSFENNPTRFANVNGTLYFTGTFGNGSYGLWMSDGTAAGTVLIMDAEVLPTSSTSPANPILNLTAVGNTLYFSAYGKSQLVQDGYEGYELWKAEGAVVTRVANIRPEAAPTVSVPIPPPLSSNPSNFFNFNGKLIFTANNGTTGTEIWTSDGTEAGTVPLGDLWVGSGSSNPSQFTIVGTNLFFVASNSTQGYELWKYTGTGAPTMVNDSNVGLSNGLDPTNSYLTAVGSSLYYRGNGGFNGWELWVSGGDSNSTAEVSNINPGSASSNPIYITNLNGVAYFYADDGIHGNELWQSGGNSQTTMLVLDINTTPGTPIQNPDPNPPTPTTLGSSDTSLFMIVLNGKLYFTANNGSTQPGSVGTELWVTDGNSAPTRLSINEINPSKGITYYSRPTIYNNGLYFVVDDGVNGRELYSTDGLLAPTLVYDIRAGFTGSFDSNSPIIAAGSNLFFIANDGIHGAEVWKFNNTDVSQPVPTNPGYDFEHNTIVITFSEDVSASIQPTDVKIQLVSGGPVFSPDSFTYNSSTNTATFKFLAPIPNGNYKFTVAATDITDESANPLSAPISGDFYTLGGDANRDRKVDALDLQILGANWQGSGKVFSTGDFNFDGIVDNFDLYILASNYGGTLAAPPPPAVPVSVTVRAPVKRTPTRTVALVDTVITR